MIYSIGFKAQGNLLEYNGQRYMYIYGDSGLMLKELCGEYPSMWDCRKTELMLPVFKNAERELAQNPTKYKYFSAGEWSGSSEISMILKELIARCEAFPVAIMEVDW